MPRIVDHAARKAEILDQSFTLFAAQGYAALSMRGIARALGVTTGTLYYYFESKEALFTEMVHRVAQRNAAEAATETPPDAPRAERLAGLLHFLQRNAAPLLQTLLISMEYHRQQGAEDAHPVNHETLAVFRQALAEQLHLSEADSTVALSVLIGVLVQLHLDPGSVNVAAHLQAMEHILPA